MYKDDLALNNLQVLICHKAQTNKQLRNNNPKDLLRIHYIYQCIGSSIYIYIYMCVCVCVCVCVYTYC